MAGNLLSTESEESLYQQINTCSRNLAACSPVVVADAGDHLARAAHVHLLDGQLALVVADHAEEAVRVEVEGADVAVLAAGHHHVVRHAQHRIDAVRVAGELVAVQPVLVLAATHGVRTALPIYYKDVTIHRYSDCMQQSPWLVSSVTLPLNYYASIHEEDTGGDYHQGCNLMSYS